MILYSTYFFQLHHDFSFGDAIDKFLQLKKQVEELYKEASRRDYLDYLFPWRTKRRLKAENKAENKSENKAENQS